MCISLCLCICLSISDLKDVCWKHHWASPSTLSMLHPPWKDINTSYSKHPIRKRFITPREFSLQKSLLTRKKKNNYTGGRRKTFLVLRNLLPWVSAAPVHSAHPWAFSPGSHSCCPDLLDFASPQHSWEVHREPLDNCKSWLHCSFVGKRGLSTIWFQQKSVYVAKLTQHPKCTTRLSVKIRVRFISRTTNWTHSWWYLLLPMTDTPISAIPRVAFKLLLGSWSVCYQLFLEFIWWKPGLCN